MKKFMASLLLALTLVMGIQIVSPNGPGGTRPDDLIWVF